MSRLSFTHRAPRPAAAVQRQIPAILDRMTRTRNEIGFSVCEYPDGTLTHGPVAEGTPTRVRIPVSCPAQSRFLGLAHSHPGGVPYPSSIDIASARRTGARMLFIIVPDRGRREIAGFTV